MDGFDDNAQPLTTTLADYLLPRRRNSADRRSTWSNIRAPTNPLGVKGIGESGTVPAAAAIVSEIEDALSDFGVIIGEIPILPARIFELVRAQRR